MFGSDNQSERELLRATGLPFEQPYAGIRQQSFEELDQSLGEMLQVYEQPWRPATGSAPATAAAR
jgi:hypothetical protein